MLGHNAYAYCLNNPLVNYDSSGTVTTTNNLSSVMAAEITAAAVIIISFGLIATQQSQAIPRVACPSRTKTKEIADTKTQADAPKDEEGIYTVYTLVDEKGIVQYVGRTKNIEARKKAHEHNLYRKGLEFVIASEGLTLSEARGLEQLLMVHYHTLNTTNNMNNQINGISPQNPRRQYYLEAAFSIFENIINNELLNALGM